MWRYLAVRIRQGIVHLPELHQHWETAYRDQYIPTLVSRDRFMQLHRYFHIVPFVHREELQAVVQKTAPFYHQCQDLLQNLYIPAANLAMNEAMIRFQGRSAWVTVIKAKPEPIGYKIFTVASEGYLLGFRIFRGKGVYDSPQAVLQHVVLDVVKPWAAHHR
jgi:hypothetical protein